MKAFELAFTLWGGTVMLTSAFFATLGFFNPFFLAFVIIGFLVALFITCPLLIPTTLLINLTHRMPYTEMARVWWLGLALIALNYLFFEALAWINLFKFDWTGYMVLFFMSSIGLVFMVIFQRTAIKKYFSQNP